MLSCTAALSHSGCVAAEPRRRSSARGTTPGLSGVPCSVCVLPEASCTRVLGWHAAFQVMCGLRQGSTGFRMPCQHLRGLGGLDATPERTRGAGAAGRSSTWPYARMQALRPSRTDCSSGSSSANTSACSACAGNTASNSKRFRRGSSSGSASATWPPALHNAALMCLALTLFVLAGCLGRRGCQPLRSVESSADAGDDTVSYKYCAVQARAEQESEVCMS